MSDPINALRGLCQDSKLKDEQLRNGFKQLESTLVDAVQGIDIQGTSKVCKLESYDCEAVYGYLLFSDSTLAIVHRCTEDDSDDPWSEDHSEPVFSIRKLEECDARWLYKLAAPAITESLFNSVAEAVRTRVDAASQGIGTLAATVNFPVRDLESAFSNVAEKLNYQVVLQDWRQAQSALGVNAANAVLQACRMLETLCKHILDTQNTPLPKDQSIQDLFKAVAKSLKLSRDQQSSDDLKRIASGISSVVQGIGELRTHVAAHGTTANRYEISFSEARLAVNSAGAIATFLMERLYSMTK